MRLTTKFNVDAILNYQEGCIVSRDLVKSPNGGVTVFAFGQGQGLSEHTVPFDALILGLDGEAEIMCAGQAHPLHAGQMILLPANQPHAVKAVTKFKMMLTRLSHPGLKHRSEAKVFNIADAVEYKDGTIINLPVLRRQSGRILIYAYDVGQERIDEMLLFDALALVLEGEVEISVQGQVHQLQARDMILLEASKSISIKAVTRFKMMLTVVEPKT